MIEFWRLIDIVGGLEQGINTANGAHLLSCMERFRTD